MDKKSLLFAIGGTLALFAVTVSANTGAFFGTQIVTQGSSQAAAVSNFIQNKYEPTAEYASAAAKDSSVVAKNYSGMGAVTTVADSWSSQNAIISTVPMATVQMSPNNRAQSRQVSFVKDQYIVEFTEPPLAVTYSKLVNQGNGQSTKDINSALVAQKAKILNERKSFIQSLSSAVRVKNPSLSTFSASITTSKSSPTPPQNSFSDVINAVVLNMTANEAKVVANLSQVKKIEQVKTMHVDLMDSVPLINAPEVWSGNFSNTPTSTPVGGITGKGIKIAIIDTGVDYLHPDLGGCFGPQIVKGQISSCKVAGGWDFVNKDADPMDDMGHGTHVADIAAGNGMPKGVAPGATVYAYKVCDSSGQCDTDNIISALEAAADPNYDGNLSDHLDIASISLGGAGDPDDIESTAADNAVKVGIVVTVAAGNAGPSPSSIQSPGSARDAITVGATDKKDNMANFSSRGPLTWTASDGNTYNLVKPDVVAPGVNICAAHWADSFKGEGDTSCYKDNLHIAISGTSMATPHVAGEAALILQLHHDWSPAEIKEAIRNSSKGLGNCPIGYSCGVSIESQGKGRVDALAAVKLPRPPIALLAPVAIGRGTINISGTATGQKFANYKLTYGYGDNATNLNDLYSSNKAITNGVMTSIDTTNLNEGTYTIKLKVTDTSGNTSTDTGLLDVNNFEIISVGNNFNYVNGGQQTIRGNVSLSNITSFKVIADEYKNSSTICSGGALSPGKGIDICGGNFSSLTDGMHDLYLEVNVNGSWKIDSPFEVAVVKELLNNWPQKLEGFTRGWIPIIFHQQNDASNTKMLIPYYDHCGVGECDPPYTLLSYDSNGSHTTLETLSDGSAIPDDGAPAVFYDAAKKENLLAMAEQFGNGQKKIIDLNGSVTATLSDYDNMNFTVVSPITIFNRDAFGQKLYTVTSHGQTNNIDGYNSNLGKLPNFPIEIPNGSQAASLVLLYPTFLSDGQNQNLAVISGDYTPDSSGYMQNLKLYFQMFSPDNKPLKKITIYDSNGKSSLLFAAYPISADLNNDGKTEMIVAYTVLDANLQIANRYDPKAYVTYMQVIDSKGNIISSMKPLVGHSITQLAVGNLGNSKPVPQFAADKSSNIKPNIVALFGDTWAVYNGRLTVFDGSLNIVFDKQEDLRLNGVSIGDVDNDGKSEIVLTYRNLWMNGEQSGIQIIDGKGSVKREIPIPTFGDSEDLSIPVLDNFNGNGNVQIMLRSVIVPKNSHAGSGNDVTSNLYALDLGSKLSTSSIDWDTFLHDNQHTGCYGYGCSISTPLGMSSSTATIVGTSTLAMTYDSTSKEVNLVSTFAVQISAGDKDQHIAKSGAFNSYITTNPKNPKSSDALRWGGYEQYDQPKGVNDDGSAFYTIPANTNAVFNVVTTFNPAVMFAGQYYGVMTNVYLRQSDNQTDINLQISQPNSTNGVVVIGEQSPYINSVSPIPVASGSTLTISGVRFGTNINLIAYLNSDPNTVSKGAEKSYQFTVRSVDGSTIKMTPNMAPGKYYLQVEHPKTGKSNNMRVEITAGVSSQNVSGQSSSSPSPSSSNYYSSNSTPSPSPLNYASNHASPSPTPTPIPTSSPTTIRNSSSPTPTPTPIHTPTPTPIVNSPSPSPSPSPTPSHSPSPSPTPTPSPTKSPSPSSSPVSVNSQSLPSNQTGSLLDALNQFLSSLPSLW